MAQTQRAPHVKARIANRGREREIGRVAKAMTGREERRRERRGTSKSAAAAPASPPRRRQERGWNAKRAPPTMHGSRREREIELDPGQLRQRIARAATAAP